MTTAKTGEAKSHAFTAIPTDTLKRYLDLLIESHTKISAAAKDAGARTTRVNDALFESFFTGQRNALEFGRHLAEHPTDFAGNAKAAFEAAQQAQSRAVEFSRLLFREQADYSQDLRKSLGEVFESAKDLTKGFGTFTAPWLKAAQ